MRIILALAAALVVASTASGMTLDRSFNAPSAPVVGSVDVLPPPVAEGCPSLPASLDPRSDCPFDPGPYSLWQGDDADAPLWTRCNYDSGNAGDPCPHSRVGDTVWFYRCADGRLAESGIGPETEQAARDDATDMCGGPWESLSLP